MRRRESAIGALAGLAARKFICKIDIWLRRCQSLQRARWLGRGVLWFVQRRAPGLIAGLAASDGGVGTEVLPKRRLPATNNERCGKPYALQWLDEQTRQSTAAATGAIIDINYGIAFYDSSE